MNTIEGAPIAAIASRSTGSKRAAQRKNAGFIGDQVLAHFDQHMGKAVHGAVPVEAIVFQRAGIGFVVADHDVGFASQTRHQRFREAPVAVPQDSDVPGARAAAPDGRETVHGDQHRHDAPLPRRRDFRRDCLVIGRVIARQALGDGGPVEVAIARNDASVGKFHHHGRIVGAPIEVDDKPRPARKDGRRREPVRKRARECARADVIGDMGGKIRWRETERPQLSGHRIGGVIAQKQQRPGRAVIADFIRFFERLIHGAIIAWPHGSHR